MSARAALPDIGAILRPILATVAPPDVPLLLANAERMAAERYRGWAEAVGDPATRAGLLACAAREDEIAALVESVHADATAIQTRLRTAHPDLAAINAAIFADRPLAEQFAIQAGGERLGAATWRSLAGTRPDGAGRDAFLACAPLEEASAVFLETLA
ncbi:MAG: hypothetical protein ABIR79_24710 [Candidatus Binatia bacterium]